jgi:predicted DNA-binding transcriptional regulator YafY
MRRADRLFQIVQLIRGRRLTTADFLARRLEVSLRTVYRDVAQLQHQGVPIEGEAGMGYRLGPGFQLPPLMFDRDEARALVAATRMAQPWLDPGLAAATESALGKILSVLPPELRLLAEGMPLHAPATGLDAAAAGHLRTLREAIQARRKLHLRYRDLHDSGTERTVRPLGCFYWGSVWTLAAWCELRGGFRGFRIDRIETLQLPVDSFRDEPGKTLADFLRQVRPPGGAA